MKRKNVLRILIIAWLIILFGLVEVGLRVYFSHFINYDVEMWKYARILKLSVEDARSHIHKPNVQAHLMGVDIKTNSLGMRDEEVESTSPILFLGDSFTLGWGVEKNKTFASLMNNEIRSLCHNDYLRVLNAGIGNYNTIQEVAAYEKQWQNLKPSHVVLFWYLNDSEPVQQLSPSWVLNHSLTAAFTVQRWNQLRSLVDHRFNYTETYKKNYFEAPGEEMRNSFLRLQSLTKENFAKFTVVLIPDLRGLKKYAFDEIHEDLMSFFKRNGIESIDLLSKFRGLEDKNLWVTHDDPHPNALTHQMIKDSLVEAVTAKGWRLCP